MPDSVADPRFLHRNDWGWQDYDRLMVNKGTGKPADIMISGIVNSSRLDVWTHMTGGVAVEPRSVIQWLELTSPEHKRSQQKYVSALANLNIVMTEASDRWPTQGVVVSGQHLRFSSCMFRDRSAVISLNRQQRYQEDFLKVIEFFGPNDNARAGLHVLSQTHSIEPVYVHYRGCFLKPCHWDAVLARSYVRVTFRLIHRPLSYCSHSFYARISNVQIIDSVAPIASDWLFGVYSDVESQMLI